MKITNASTRLMRVILHAVTSCGPNWKTFDVNDRIGPTLHVVSHSNFAWMRFGGPFLCSYKNNVKKVSFSFGFDESEEQPINWYYYTNTIGTYDGIKKHTGGNAWNSGATSLNKISKEKAQFIINSTDDDIFFGINDTFSSDASWSGIDEKIYVSKYRGNEISLWKNSTQTYIYPGTYEAGDVIIMEKHDGQLYFYKNSTYLGYFTLTPNGDSYVDLAMYNLNAELQDTKKRP